MVTKFTPYGEMLVVIPVVQQIGYLFKILTNHPPVTLGVITFPVATTTA